MHRSTRTLPTEYHHVNTCSQTCMDNLQVRCRMAHHHIPNKAPRMAHILDPMLPPQEIRGTFTHTSIRAQLLLHHLVLGSERLLLKCVVDWLLVHRLAVHSAASDQDAMDQVVRYTLDRLAVEDGQQGVLHHLVPDSSAAGRHSDRQASLLSALVRHGGPAGLQASEAQKGSAQKTSQ